MKNVFHNVRYKSPGTLFQAWTSLACTRREKNEIFLNFVFGDLPGDVNLDKLFSLPQPPMSVTDTSFWARVGPRDEPPNVALPCIPMTVFAEIMSTHFARKTPEAFPAGVKRLRANLSRAIILDFQFEEDALKNCGGALSPTVPDERIIACAVAIRALPGGKVATIWSRDRGLMSKALKHNIHCESYRTSAGPEDTHKKYMSNVGLSRIYHKKRERSLYRDSPFFPDDKTK